MSRFTRSEVAATRPLLTTCIDRMADYAIPASKSHVLSYAQPLVPQLTPNQIISKIT